jgi:hypothetical protein
MAARTIILIILAIFVGLIWYGLKNPEFFHKISSFFGKK